MATCDWSYRKKAPEENTTKFDRLVTSFIKTVTSALKPLLARKPKDEEKWVIDSRAQVSKLVKERRDEKRRGECKRGCDHEDGELRAKAQGER